MAADPPPPPNPLPSRRHIHGRAHLANVVNWWMARSGFSHAHLSALADWGLGEQRWLIGSQISHIRNNHYKRSSLQTFEALGAANLLLWSWVVEGAEKCQKRYGPRPSQALTDTTLNAGVWLQHPTHTDEPLEFENFCSIFAGRLTLPYVDTVVVSPSEARVLTIALADLLDAIVCGWSGTLRERIARLMESYPPTDATRRERLRKVLLGSETLSQEQLEQELLSCSHMVRLARGLPEGSYGPAELYGELSSGRQRT